MIVVAVTDTMKVTANVIATAAPVDNSELSDLTASSALSPVNTIKQSYTHRFQ